MKKILVILFLTFCGCMFFLPTQISTAANSSSNPFDASAGNYQPLSPITAPGGQKVDNSNFPAYLQAMYRIGIGACFVLGVIMFTWAGIEYIVSESMNTKADGKARMTAALTGLAIALVSYILLYTINPDLLSFKNILPAADTQNAP
jgi:hypothetical protein